MKKNNNGPLSTTSIASEVVFGIKESQEPPKMPFLQETFKYSYIESITIIVCEEI